MTEVGEHQLIAFENVGASLSRSPFERVGAAQGEEQNVQSRSVKKMRPSPFVPFRP
jgi:hypothetical protein